MKQGVKQRGWRCYHNRFPSFSDCSPDALAALMRGQFPSQNPAVIAAACGIRLRYEKLPLFFGRTIYLAEALLQPPSITVNVTAIEKLAQHEAQVVAAQRLWFTTTAITTVVIAHELYHIITQQPSNPAIETQAHEFAQALTGLPFSPRHYETILQNTTAWTTTNII